MFSAKRTVHRMIKISYYITENNVYVHMNNYIFQMEADMGLSGGSHLGQNKEGDTTQIHSIIL